jgi:hypothetical protein
MYHIEVTPSEAEIYDRVIVQKLIKEGFGLQAKLKFKSKGRRILITP